MKFNILKKFLFIFVLSLFAIGMIGCGDDSTTKPTDSETETEGGEDNGDDSEEYVDAVIYFHYQRTNKDYEGWNLWLWEKEGQAIEGEMDDFGLVFKVDASDPNDPFYHVTTFGYIFRLNEWEQKDKVSKDRFVDINSRMKDAKGEIHLYSWEGVETMYLDIAKTKPICFIKSFQLDENLKSVTLETNTKAETYQLLADGEVIKSSNCSNSKMTITLPKKFVLGETNYSIRVDFGDNNVFTEDLFMGVYYDSKEFTEAFVYEGDDLGVSVEGGKTTFKLWAPISNKVSVQLYEYGHPTSLGTTEYPGDNKPVKEFELTMGEKGVWSTTVNEDLYGYYYTYTVKNGSTTTKGIVDPYAKATGVNSLRGYIIDFSETNPSGWNKNYTRPYSATQLIVYEMHVRDLTMDDTWNGTEKNRGTYLGLAETGTTYKGVTTGFDHIKELGVNAVQILPFFDQANDETDKEQFNWGYNPQNYNVLEGQYSTNPYDAEVRVREFKQMKLAYEQAGIEVIMDVVYNHMNGVSGAAFDMIIPGYYFRYNDAGELSNGSGCGNEVACERKMVHNFIVDSTKFWVTEYHVDGFRFDLMALHDRTTMEAVATELHAIDKNIVVYGEPWTGGSTTLPSYSQASTLHMTKFNGYGGFNDELRNAIKGGVFTGSEAGWVQGNGGQDSIVNSMDGLWKNLPTRQVNYNTCHDNNTLADKLYLTGLRGQDIADASVVANSIVFMSEGIAFMLNGDEILRSKPLLDDNNQPLGAGQFSHNSYNLPDACNSIKWDEKVTNLETFKAYKALIAIAREQSLFHFSTAEDCANYTNLWKDNYCIQNVVSKANSEEGQWDKAMIIITNAKANNYKVDKISGDWKVAYAYNTNLTVGQTVNSSITVNDYAVVILYQE